MPEITDEAGEAGRALALAGECGARVVADVERELHAYTDSRDRGAKPYTSTLAGVYESSWKTTAPRSP